MRAGFDASYMDPLGHMMLGSEDYRYFMQVMQVRIDDGCAAAAGQSCQDVAETQLPESAVCAVEVTCGWICFVHGPAAVTAAQPSAHSCTQSWS